MSFVSAAPNRAVDSVSGNSEFWDDLSGKPLNPELVRKARAEEMSEYARHGVYRIVPIAESWEKTGKAPIGSRWVDINKGDDANPEYRSRLVAQELNKHKREHLFPHTALVICGGHVGRRARACGACARVCACVCVCVC